MSLLLLTGLLSARHSFVYLLLRERREAAEQVSKKDKLIYKGSILSNFCNFDIFLFYTCPFSTVMRTVMHTEIIFIL